MQLPSFLVFALGAAAAVAAPLTTTASADSVTTATSPLTTIKATADSLQNTARTPIIYHLLPANPDGLPLDPCSDKNRFDQGTFGNPNGNYYK